MWVCEVAAGVLARCAGAATHHGMFGRGPASPSSPLLSLSRPCTPFSTSHSPLDPLRPPGLLTVRVTGPASPCCLSPGHPRTPWTPWKASRQPWRGSRVGIYMHTREADCWAKMAPCLSGEGAIDPAPRTPDWTPATFYAFTGKDDYNIG